ncbi:hypothetical protein [Pseudomaricurvus sp. HS19]|uniref:hypothetical protein n=1 Tax=Pseudomaricurvus sp. HS19 TaxID=2692626 RepID=UPI00136A0BDC|nr:hypothetical protein [Pseudomaricurvus sp. HS19]MYM63630.1 hypothetical protein [Pseudomaricurvus sp. HS19]
MLLPTIIFLVFAVWTLFHWQELPELLKNEAIGVEWPLSIHHTATPLRLLVMSGLYLVFALSLFYVCVCGVRLVWDSKWAAWLVLAVLIVAQFAPLSATLASYIRYLFQRHLFFPPLPSHQEDAIIETLMSQAEHEGDQLSEIEHLHKLLKQQFRSGLSGPSIMSLRDEKALVRREFTQMRSSGLFQSHKLSDIEKQQIRFHLYSCYRLLTRVILSKHWAGRDRRKVFRDLGYSINTGDGSFYSNFRRMKYSVNHYVLHRKQH